MFFKKMKARALAKCAVLAACVMGEELPHPHSEQDGPYFFGPDYMYEDSKIMIYIFGGEENGDGGYLPATIQVYAKEYDEKWLVLNVSDGYERVIRNHGPYVGILATVDQFHHNRNWEVYLRLLAKGAATEVLQST